MLVFELNFRFLILLQLTELFLVLLHDHVVDEGVFLRNGLGLVQLVGQLLVGVRCIRELIVEVILNLQGLLLLPSQIIVLLLVVVQLVIV